MPDTMDAINKHFKKNSTVDPNGSLRVKGLSELNQKLNNGKPFVGDILKFAVTHDRIPTDTEIAKMPKQGQSPSLWRGNNDSKEKPMPDLSEASREFTEAQEAAFKDALLQNRVVKSALKDGTFCCLLGADGYAETQPALNLSSPGQYYHGVNFFFLKEHQKKIGAPTAEYVTAERLEKIKAEIPCLALKEGQQGISIHSSEKVEGTEDQWETKSFRLVNIHQTTMPGEIKKHIEQKRQEWSEARDASMREQEGDFYQPRQPREKKPGPEIACGSTSPEKYLGQYLAAVSLGGRFKASPGQGKEFAEKLAASMSEEMPNGFPDPFKLSKICREAGKQCREITKEFKTEARQQSQEQQQHRSRGR